MANNDRVIYYGRNDCDGYFAIARDGMKLHCSCGRPLVKITETRWRCSAGWPEYDIAQGDMAFDKYGNIMLKAKPHEDDQDDKVHLDEYGEDVREMTRKRVDDQFRESGGGKYVGEGDVDQIRRKLGQEDSTIKVSGAETNKNGKRRRKK